MKLLLTLLIISLISTIVSSTKCKNTELKCIELCCNKTQYYVDIFEYCENIPKDVEALWHAQLRDNMTVEFVEYGICMAPDDLFIASCFSPYWHNNSKEFDLKRWLKVPCHRLDEPICVWPVGALVYAGVLPFCLPIMVVYTVRKGLMEKFSFILLAWYLASMSLGLLTDVTASMTDLILKKLIDQLSDFFHNSTCLWLNVIGYQLWSNYKEPISQDNTTVKNRKRFLLYSIFVWGIAAIIASLDLMLSGGQWSMIVGVNSRRVIAIYNLATFLMLSVNIFITRYSIAKLLNETLFKRKLACIICRLYLIMGIPRMTIIIMELFIQINYELKLFLCILEPFVIFIVVVLKPMNAFNWILVIRKKRLFYKLLICLTFAYKNIQI